MKTKKELECFLTIIELQEMMIPMLFPFKKLFVRRVIRFIRNCISDMEGELINLEELQMKIDTEIFPQILNGKLTRWQVNWLIGIMNCLSYLE